MSNKTKRGHFCRSQPQWVVRSPAEEAVYERMRGLKVSDMTPGAHDGFISPATGDVQLPDLRLFAQMDEPSNGNIEQSNFDKKQSFNQPINRRSET